MTTKLNFRPLICYSIGNVTLTAIYGYLGMFLLKFYTDHVKLDPALVGWAFIIRSVVDALIDPGIGYLSDRTRMSGGRRRPYFLLGSIPAAILFYLMMIPPSGSPLFVTLYLTIISTLMVCFLSLMGIPHLAFGFEMTADYDERTRIFGYKNLVENITILIATFSVPLALMLDGQFVLGRQLTRADCYCIAAAFLAILSVAAAVIAYLGTTESKEYPPDSSNYRFIDGVYGILSNNAFRIVLIVFVLMTIADRLISAEFFILIEQFHGLREEDSFGLLLGFFAGGVLSVWPWVWLAQRFGKDTILRIAIALWPFACIALVARHWTEMQLCLVCFCIGAFGTGMVTVMGAMVPDVLEYDRARTHERREGMYVSIVNVVYQAAMGFGFLIAGQTLHAIGYRGEKTDSPELVNGLRVTFGIVPLISSAIALIALNYFPITRKSYEALVTTTAPLYDRQ